MVWGVCLLFHRRDEGLGAFTLSNPLDLDAKAQYMSDEAGFIAKAREYTRKFATAEYQHGGARKRWHGFYPESGEPSAWQLGCVTSLVMLEGRGGNPL